MADNPFDAMDTPAQTTANPFDALDAPAPAKSVAPPAAKPISMGDRFETGVTDPFLAAAQMAGHALPASVLSGANRIASAVGAPTVDFGTLDKDAAQREKNYQASRAASGNTGIDWARGAGNVAGTVPLAFAAPEVEGVGGAAAVGAGMGAANGALTPVTNGGNNFWSNKAGQTAIGAGTGTVGGAALQGLSRVVQPNIAPDVQMLMDKGVTPTPGQILGGVWQNAENAMTHLPFTGGAIKNAQGRALDDFNNAVYNDVLQPIGGTYNGPAGHEAIASINKTLSDGYDNTLAKMQFQTEPEFEQRFSNLTDLAVNMPDPQAKQFDKIVTDKFLSRLGPDGGMDGQTLKGVDSELGRLASGYQTDTSFDQRQLGSAVKELQSSIRDSVKRTNPDDLSDQLSGLDTAWAKYKKLETAAGSAGAPDGKFTPAQFMTAVRSGAPSAGTYARGQASMQDLAKAGRSVLGKTYPDSGTGLRTAVDTAAGLGTGAISPVAPFALMAGRLPYTQTGQKIISSALTQRPSIAQPIAQGISSAIPYAGGIVPTIDRGGQ